MAPKNIGPQRPDKKEVKMRNGMVIGPKTKPLSPKDALKAGLIKQIKKPITPIKCADTPVEVKNGKRVPGSRPANPCGACHSTGVESYNAFTKKQKDCKKCHGAGYL